MNVKTFWEFVEYLRKKHPFKRYKFHVRRVAGMKDPGGTSVPSDRGMITICIRKTDPLQVQLDTLIHEWGHAYEYDVQGVHGKTWGVGNSMAYETWEEFARG